MAIEPSPPALDTAAAIAGVEMPAIGACTIGMVIPSLYMVVMRA